MSASVQHLGLKPGIYHDVSEANYHADLLCDRPTLSRSEMLLLVDESPLHCWAKHPRLGGIMEREATKKMDFGSLGHALVLGKGAAVAIGDFDNWMTKASKEFREEARAGGQIPVLRKDFELGTQVAELFRGELKRFGLDGAWDAGRSEAVCLWNEGEGCDCRCMFDRLAIDEEKKRAVIFDPKFSEAMNPNGLSRHMFNQNFHVQEQHYKRGLESVRPDLAGRVDFIYLFMSVEPPHVMVPATLNGEFQMLGVSKVMRGYDAWKRCLSLDRWPSYTDEVVRVEPPAYGLNAEMGAKTILPK